MFFQNGAPVDRSSICIPLFLLLVRKKVLAILSSGFPSAKDKSIALITYSMSLKIN